MKKRVQNRQASFLSAAPDGDVVSIYRNLSKCRHYCDTLRDGSKRELRLRCSAFFSSQLILPGLRPGNPQRLAASSNSNLDLIGGELIFARRGRLW